MRLKISAADKDLKSTAPSSPTVRWPTNLFLKQQVVFNSFVFSFAVSKLGGVGLYWEGGPGSELHIYLDPKGLLAAVCSS